MTEREGYPEEPFMLVHVIPSIDGEPRFTDYRNYPFEALAVYGQGLKQGEIWPFNCEWGYAACAGFNAPALLTVDEHHVYLKLPDDYDSLTSSGHGELKQRDHL